MRKNKKSEMVTSEAKEIKKHSDLVLFFIRPYWVHLVHIM